MIRIAQYDGLYGESTARPEGEYLFSELLETRSHTFDWIIHPHTHTHLFQVFYVQAGTVQVRTAQQSQLLEGPCVLLIPPNALHGFVYSADARGRILTLSDSLLDDFFRTNPAMQPLLNTVQTITVFDASYSAASVLELIEEIDEELFSDQIEKRIMIQACLHRLFIILYRLLKHGQTYQPDQFSPAMTYFRQFQQLIRQATMATTIAQVADEMAISPVHLNRICRAVTAKSASELMQNHLVNEAKKYLAYTAYSISEIAYQLHFEYPTYFARFFKRKTGVSPSQYREQLRASGADRPF